MLNQQSWLSHVVLHSWCGFSLRCNPFFEIWICKWLSERIFKHPAKKHQRAGSSKTKHFRKPSHSLTKENCFSLFRSRRLFGEWIKRPEALILSQEELCVSKKSKKMQVYHVPYMTSQYETNLWSTHVNIVRLAEPIRRCVRWRTRGVCLQAFPSFRFPSPSPLLHFFDRSSVFLCLETKRKRLLRRLTAKKNYLGFATPGNVLKLFFWGQDWARRVREFSVKSVIGRSETERKVVRDISRLLRVLSFISGRNNNYYLGLKRLRHCDPRWFVMWKKSHKEFEPAI